MFVLTAANAPGDKLFWTHYYYCYSFEEPLNSAYLGQCVRMRRAVAGVPAVR